MLNKHFIYSVMFLALTLVFTSCQKKEETASLLKNDCIKRTLGPNLVGQQIEFAYAMALPQSEGKIVSTSVEASIAGATGTWLENKSYYTNGSGQDVGIVVGDPSVNTGTKTDVTFTVDTCASTLRYYYVIPEEARGQSVTFTFSTTGSNGETVSYSMGPYIIAKMDMKLDILVKDKGACYFSVDDMAVYDSTTAASMPDKIDLVYLYKTYTSGTFGHALVSPSTDPAYLPGINLPAGVNRSSKIRKVWALRDRHLARLQYGIYIDDIDFTELNLSDAPDYSINLKAESGIWVETVDGKYRAYIFVNSVNNTTKSMVVSIKRYLMQ